MPQELQNVLNPSESVALIGRKMTERFLEKQTANFYSFFYSRLQPSNTKLWGNLLPGLPENLPPSFEQDELLAPHKNVHNACACVAKPCAHTVRPLPRTTPFPRRPSPTAEAALVRYPSRARRCDCRAFSRQIGLLPAGWCRL